MEEINLREYFLILKQRKWLIVSITIICLLLTGIISHFVTGPKYQTYTTLIVKENIDLGKDDIDQNRFDQKIINNYSEIVKSRLVMDEVKKNLGLGLEFIDIIEKVDLNIVPDSNIVKIEVTGSDSKVVAQVANEIASVSIKHLKDITKVKKVEVIDEAKLPKKPMKTNIKTNIIISGIIGLVMSTFLAFFLEYLNNTIRTTKDIKRHLNLPITGIVPEHEKKLSLYDEPESFAAEAYRNIRSNIQILKDNKKVKTILITSAEPNEGKSIIAANIAIAMAQIGEKVLLVDGNLRNPKLHNFFNTKNKQGLSNVLNENINYKEVIDEVERENNLQILTSGSSLSNPAELLASRNMKDLLEKVKDEYDLVIIDSSSLGVMADTAVISTIVDGTFLVCTSGQSSIEDVKIGKELLQEVNANILGTILNKASLDENDYYKYYYNSYLYYKGNK